ncbi:MAG: hypothetical protein KAT30_07040 [Candidatus Krumholzibacteria bacterium]|nr:hypothetical protein [Candidatus Krumholzibacteria bacterium]
MVLLSAMIPSHAFAETSAVIRSILFPGTGQAHQGNYTKASIFAGAAIVSGVGLFVSAINYNRQVDRFESAEANYNSLVTTWENGEIINATVASSSYNEMVGASDSADSWLKWRNVFLTTLAATYAINLIDVLISKPHEPETALRYQIEASPKRVLLTRSFRF